MQSQACTAKIQECGCDLTREPPVHVTFTLALMTGRDYEMLCGTPLQVYHREDIKISLLYPG